MKRYRDFPSRELVEAFIDGIVFARVPEIVIDGVFHGDAGWFIVQMEDSRYDYPDAEVPLTGSGEDEDEQEQP